LTKWALLETDEINEVNHEWLLQACGMQSQLSDEYFEFFVQYCVSALGDKRRAKVAALAKAARLRLGELLQALGHGGDENGKNDGDEKHSGDESESESGSGSEDTSDSENEKEVPKPSVAPKPAVAKKTPNTKKRGKRGGSRGKGAN
jgi:hypothetical protein